MSDTIGILPWSLKPDDKASVRAAKQIVSDINNRSGFSLYDIDYEILEEMISTFADIIGENKDE